MTNAERDRRIIEEYQSGLSILDVSVKLHHDERTVRKAIKAAGIMRHGRGHNKATRLAAGADKKMLAGAV
jgi:hypothetical protein